MKVKGACLTHENVDKLKNIAYITQELLERYECGSNAKKPHT